MSVTIAQTKIGTANASSISLTTNATAGNTVVVSFAGYGSTNAVTTSSPTIGGAADASAYKLIDAVGITSSLFMYDALWVFPAVTSGANNFGITFVSSSGTSFPVAWEISGLGTPVSGATGGAGGITSGTGQPASAGTLTVTRAGIIFGASNSNQSGASGFTAPGSPWTAQTVNGGFQAVGTILLTGSEGTETWAPTLGATSAHWASAAGILYPQAAAVSPGMLIASMI